MARFASRLANAGRFFSNGIAGALSALPISSEFLGAPRGFYWHIADYFAQIGGNGCDLRPFLVPPEQIVVPETVRICADNGEEPLASFQYAGIGLSLNDCESFRIYARPPISYLPGAVITNDDRLLVSHSFWWGDPSNGECAFLQKPWLGRCRSIKGKSLYLGLGSNYFHCIFDAMLRLATLDLAQISLSEFDNIILFRPRLAHELELLSLLGLSKAQMLYHDEAPHIKAERLYLGHDPTVMQPFHFGMGESIVRLLQQYLTKLTGIAPHARPFRKLLISRAGGSRRILNERELAHALSKIGFQLITLEGMSIVDQLLYFSEAAVVVGSGGAGFSNCIMSPPGAHLISCVAHNYTKFDRNVWRCFCGASGIKYTEIECSSAPGGADMVANVPVILRALSDL